MENKYILIIVVIIAVIIAIAGMIMLNINTKNNIEHETLQLSDTCALSVPVCNNSTFTEENGIKSYNGTDVQIMSYNKNDLGTFENLGADIGLMGSLNQNFKYNHTHQGKNILIHPEENKTIFACLITNNTTGDVLVVASQNEEILYHVIDSVNFTINNNTANATNNATTSNPVKTSDSNVKTKDTTSKKTDEKTVDEGAYAEGYIAENDQDFDYDGDGVGDGSAYHSHEYYVEMGQNEPVPLGGG